MELQPVSTKIEVLRNRIHRSKVEPRQNMKIGQWSMDLAKISRQKQQERFEEYDDFLIMNITYILDLLDVLIDLKTPMRRSGSQLRWRGSDVGRSRTAEREYKK